MNILYLLKILDTKKLSELVASIDAPALDANLALWGALERGEIEIDEDKDRVEALQEAEVTGDQELANKIIRVVQHYAKNKANITRGRLNSYIKDPMTNQGYPTHEYLMAVQYLIDTGQIIEHIQTVPKTKKRPFHRFVFLCLPENEKDDQNAEWNAKAIRKWIEGFEKNKVK